VNTVAPGTVDTDLVQNQPTYDLFAPDHDNPTREDVAPMFQSLNILPYPWVEPQAISAMVLFLASDDARYITGSTMSVDLGTLTKH
jgi:NAD(P)-dependent dehydrogenase (short-subunit alcohol dehydrogenase family)